MLGITRIAVGTAGAESPTYLLDQVAVDRHDYYAGHGEAEGQWFGAGAATMGLSGQVSRLEFGRLLSGNDPTTGAPLRSGKGLGPLKVMGYDYTFSAPKSVSLAWAMGSDYVREQIAAAEAIAVVEGMGYLERTPLVTRRGAGGKDVIKTTGMVGAVFRHRTSRAGDPDLHSHVAVAAVVQGVDGKWGTLWSAPMYAHAKTAGYIYQARLRAEITQRLGLAFGEVTNGHAELVAVPTEMCEKYSKRRKEIVDLVGKDASAKARQFAATTTRPEKELVPEPESLHGTWRRKATESGYDMDAYLSGPQRGAPQPSVNAVFKRLGGEEGLTQQRTSFSRRDVIQGIAGAMPAGATAQSLEAQADGFLASHGVELKNPVLTTRDTIRRSDGRIVAATVDESRYTSTDLLDTERRVIAQAMAARKAGAGVVSFGPRRHALAQRPTIGEDQKDLVKALTTSGAGVQVVIAKAGTGKTFTVDAARDAWETDGYAVIGLAPSHTAANELAKSTGMPADTVASFLMSKKTLPKRTVVVVDEAAMVGTRSVAAILARRAPDTKVVLMGDDGQLPSVDAGGIISTLAKKLGYEQLHEVRRFADPVQRDAADALRSGRIAEAMAAYDRSELLHYGDSVEDVYAQMVAHWTADRHDGVVTVMQADRWRHVETLNDLAREVLRSEGALGVDQLFVTSRTHNQRAFAVGDHIKLIDNDRRLGVFNKDAGKVTAIDVDQRTMTVAMTSGKSSGRTVVLPADFIDGHRSDKTGAVVTHAYAQTVYASQGMTVDRTHYFGAQQSFREGVYVALSRARAQNHLYGVRQSWESVVKAIEESRAHHAAVDQLKADVRVARQQQRREVAKSVGKKLSSGAAASGRAASRAIERRRERRDNAIQPQPPEQSLVQQAPSEFDNLPDLNPLEQRPMDAWEVEAADIEYEDDGRSAWEHVDEHDDGEFDNLPDLNPPGTPKDVGGAERRAQRELDRQRDAQLRRERGDGGHGH